MCLKTRLQPSALVVLLCLTLISMFACNGPEEKTTTDHALDPVTITIVSYGGGAYQASHRAAFCEPYALYTGHNVESISWNAEYGKLKAMVESGRVPWSVVEVTAAQFKRGKTEDLFVPLTVRPDQLDFLPKSVDTYGVANMYWGTVLAYRKDQHQDVQPETWADFFDVGKFPGKRAMYDDPRGTLEFALLADGVPIQELYPLDVERAMRKLDELRPHIEVWWSDGTQPVQLLQTGTVVMTPAWNGRIYADADARRDLGYSWNGAALELDYWVIPKGAAHPDLASRFIAFASSPEAMARQTTMVGYGPVNSASFEFISEDVGRQLPTHPENWEISFVVDADWWSANEESVKARWISWKVR